MFDVMIVDDEYPIRESIKLMVPWEKLGLHVVCEAGDGDTAWELFTTHHPKIVISDINIPFLSGLELSKRIAEVDPDVCFIIITGFFEFSVAQDSVKIGAVNLISKPIMADELIDSLKQAVHQLTTRINEQRRQENMLAMMEESRIMLIETYFSQLLHTDKENATPILNRLKSLRTTSFGSYCAVVLISLVVPEDDISDTVMVAAKNMFQKIAIQQRFSCFSYYNDHSELVGVLSWDDDKLVDILCPTITRFSEQMLFYFNTHILSGIGTTVDNPSLLRQSYLTALRARNWLEANPQERVASYQDIAATNLQEIQEIPSVKEIMLCIQGAAPTRLFQKIEQQLSSMNKNPDGIIKERTFALLFTANIIAAWSALSSDYSVIQRCANTLADINHIRTGTDLYGLLCTLISDATTCYVRKQETGKNALMDVAQQYILDNLSDSSLNLEQVSRHIGFSSPYFCRVFHRESGLSFNEYLNRVRIEKAKNLLKDPLLKVNEVGRLSGYNTPTHFNYIFKRLVGKTPSEYKKYLETKETP